MERLLIFSLVIFYQLTFSQPSPPQKNETDSTRDHLLIIMNSKLVVSSNMKCYLKFKAQTMHDIKVKIKTSTDISAYYSPDSKPDYIFIIDYYDSLFNPMVNSFLAFDNRPNFIGSDQVPTVDFVHPNHINSLNEATLAPKVGLLPVVEQGHLDDYFFKVSQSQKLSHSLGASFYTSSKLIAETNRKFVMSLARSDTTDFTEITSNSQISTDTTKLFEHHYVKNKGNSNQFSFNNSMLWINQDYSISFSEINILIKDLLNLSLFDLTSPVINAMLYTPNYPYSLDKTFIFSSFYYTLPSNYKPILSLADIWSHYLDANIINNFFYTRKFEWLFSSYIILGDPTIEYEVPVKHNRFAKPARSETVSALIPPDDIRISPNPGNANIMIQLGGEIHAQKLIVYDIRGRTLLTKSIAPETHSLHLPEVETFASGTYFMKIRTLEQKTYLRKFTLTK